MDRRTAAPSKGCKVCILLSIFVLSCISSNCVSGLPFPTTGSGSLCLITDPSRYVNISNLPFRGAVTVGRSSLLQTSWTGQTSICLKSVAGYGIALAAVLSLNRVVESADDGLEYGRGHFGNASLHRFATTGGHLVYLVGSDFGVHDFSPTIMFGLGKILSRQQPMLLASYMESTIIPVTKWNSDSSIRFSTAIGNGRGLWVATGETNAQMLVLKIEQITTSATSMFSFAPPNVLPNIQQKLSTGSMVYVIGSGFSTWNDQPKLTFALGSRAYMSRWISDSSVQAKVFASIFNGLTSVIVTVASQTGNHLAPWNASMNLSLSFFMVPSTGSKASLIPGYGFGVHQNSATSQTIQSASESTQWMSDSHVSIKMVPLQERKFGMSLTLNQFTGVFATKLEASFHSVEDLLQETAFPSSGSNMLFLKIFSVGILHQSTRCRLGSSSRSSCASSLWMSDSSIVARINSGLPSNFSVFVSLHNVVASGIGNLALNVSNISLWQRPLCIPVTGSHSQLILGSSLESNDMSVRIRLTNTACQISAWNSDSGVTCKIPDVSKLDARTLSLFFSVPFQALKSADGLNASILVHADSLANISFLSTSTGSQRVLIALNLHAISDISMQFRSGNSESRRSIWLSHSSVVLKLSHGSGANLSVYASLSNPSCVKSSIGLSSMSYMSSKLNTNMTVQNISVCSGSIIHQLVGNGFGLAARSISVQLKTKSASSLELTNWIADSALSCKIPAFLFRNTSMFVSCEMLVSNSVTIASGDRQMRIIALMSNFSTHAQTGGDLIRLVLSSFGAMQVSSKARMASSSPDFSFWLSDSSALCKKSSKERSRLQVVVISINSYLSGGAAYEDDGEAALSFMNAFPIPSSASSILTIRGAFSICNQSPKLKLSPSDCPASTWISSSSVQCKIPSGIVSTWTVSSTLLMSSASFVVSRVSWSVIPLQSNLSFSTTGSQNINVVGRYSVFDSSVKSKFEVSDSHSSQWISDSQLNSKYVSGHGRLSNIHISVGFSVRSIRVSSSGYTFNLPSFQPLALFNNTARPRFLSTGSVGVQLVLTSGLGTMSRSGRFRLQLSAAKATNWLSDSMMLVKVCPGINMNTKFTLTIAIQISESSLSFLKPPIYPSPTEIALQPVTGASLMELSGNSLIICHGSIKIRMGMSASTLSLWISSSSIVAKILPGIVFSKSLSISSDSIVETSLFYLSYLSPRMNFSSDSRLSTSNSVILVTGMLFASVSQTCSLRFSVSSSSATRWISTSSMTGMSISGSGLISIVIASFSELKCNSTSSISFEAPLLTSSNDVGFAASGSIIIFASGSHIGTFDATANSRISVSASAATRWISSSSTVIKQCDVFHLNASIFLSVADFRVSSSTVICSNRSECGPSVSGVSSSIMMNSGSFHIVVTGNHFTTNNQSPHIRFSLSSVLNSLWISESSISAKVAHSVLEGGYVIDISIGRTRTTRIFPSVSANFTNISSMSSYNAPTTGNILITMFGHGFGTHWVSSSVQVGFLSPHVIWISDSSVACKLNAFVSSPAKAKWNGINVSSLIFLFNAMVVSTLSRYNSPTVQSEAQISLFGSQFGLLDPIMTVLIGSEKLRTKWISESCVITSPVLGTGQNLTVTMVSKYAVGNAVSQTFSYDTLSLIPGSDDMVPTVGGAINIFGTNFGTGLLPIPSASIGLTACTDVSRPVEDFITCNVQPGVGRSLSICVHRSAEVFCQADSFSYRAPSVRDYNSSVVALPATGKSMITVFGLDFGVFSYCPIARLARNNQMSTHSMSTLWKSTTNMRSLTSHAVGDQITLFASVSLQSSNRIQCMFSKPLFTSSNALIGAPATSSFHFFILAINLGLSSHSIRSNSLKTSSEASIWTSETFLMVKSSYRALFFDVASIVSVDRNINSRSDTIDTRFSKPFLSFTTPTDSSKSSSGSMIVTTTGHRFCSIDSSPSARFIRSTSEAFSWISDSIIVTKASVWIYNGASHTLLVSSNKDATEILVRIQISEDYYYELGQSIEVTSLSKVNFTSLTESTGSTHLMIVGSSFGHTDSSLAIKFFSTSFTLTAWTSQSSILCKVFTFSSRKRGSAVLSLNSNLAHSFIPSDYSFLGSIVSASSLFFPSTGSQATPRLFSAIGSFDQSTRTRSQLSAQDSSQWVSDSSMISKISSGIGRSLWFQISTDTINFSNNWSSSYSIPNMSTSFASNLSSSGSVQITCYGSSFGVQGLSLRTKYFYTSVESTLWTSDSCIIFKLISFARNSQPSAMVSLGLQIGVFYFIHDQLLYNLTNQRSNDSLLLTGSSTLSIVGSSMMQVDMSNKVSLRNSACCFSLWQSTSSMLCKIPSYSFSPIKVVISVDQKRLEFINNSHIMGNVVWANNSYEFPTTGSIVHMSARGLGNFDISATVSLSTSCEGTFWRADSLILCKTPRSESMRVDMMATFASCKVSSNLIFVHSVPYITEVYPSATPSTGLNVLTISGSGFAFHDFLSAPIRIGTTLFQSSFFVSDSSLLTITPAGEGSVNINFVKHSTSAATVTYFYGSIVDTNASLSDSRTGHVAQLQVEFVSSQTIEKFGSIFVYLPSQIQLESQSLVDWIYIAHHGYNISSKEFSLQHNFVKLQAQQAFPSGKFSIYFRNVALSSTVSPISPMLIRSSMESNITIDVGLHNFNTFVIPSNATEFLVKHSVLHAGDTVNVSVFLKTFNSVEKGDIFVIQFPQSGASFASTFFSASVDLSLLHRSNYAFKIVALTSDLANYSFTIFGIVLQPFAGNMSSFSGNHCNHLGVLKENWIGTDGHTIHPGKMQNVKMQVSNNTIGSTMDMEISFIPANNLEINSIISLEFDSNDVSFTNQVYMGSTKLFSFYDGNKKVAVQISTTIFSGSTVNITFKNAFINLGPSRSTSAMFSSEVFHSAWNSSAFYQVTTIDTGTSNVIMFIAPNFHVDSTFSSLQMRARVHVNMTMHVPNKLPPLGSLEIILLNYFNFSETNMTISSNCFQFEWSSAVLLGSKAIFSFQSIHLTEFQNCLIHFGPIESPGFPGYNGRVNLVIRSQHGVFAFGHSTKEFFFVSFLSAKVTGNCSVSLSWNNTALVDLPESWAISCSACSDAFRQKTFAPHLRFYHYTSMPCLSGIEFVFVLREIDINGTAVIPKALLNLDAFEFDQWSAKLTLVTLPSAPKITNLNQTLSKRVSFNWIQMPECHGSETAYCPIVSTSISITSICHPSPDVYFSTLSFFDITFEFSTNHTVCLSFINAAGSSLPTCFSQDIVQPYQSSASISFVEIPRNTRAGVFFTPAVTVRLQSLIAEPLGNLTVFSSFTLNETKSYAASYRSCAVTSENGLAVFDNMSFAGIGSATMDAFMSISQTVRSPEFQTTIGPASKLAVFNAPKVATAAIAFPSNLFAEVMDEVENVHTELVFNATLTFTSTSDANKAITSFFTASSNGVSLFENVSIAEVGDYFGQVHVLNFKSTLFVLTVLSGASISIQAEIQPSDSWGGEKFSPLQPLLTLRDRGNNIAIDYFDYVITSFDFASDANAKIMGTSEKFSYLGVCRFYDMAINLAGQYRLKYSAVGLIPAISSIIVVAVGAPVQLAILKQPSDTVAGNVVLQFAYVRVEDRGTNLVNTSNSSVTAELSGFNAGVPVVELSTAILGVATFSNMNIQINGTSYFFMFSAPGLLSIRSQPFAVVPGPAALLNITSFPKYGLGGLFFEPRVQLYSSDFWGNALHSGYANGPDRTTVISVQSCSYFSCFDKLLGNQSSNFYDGVASFRNSALSLIGWYVLSFSSDNISVSRNITVYNSNATFLTLEREPLSCFGGDRCTLQPIVTIRDVATNVAEIHPAGLIVNVFANTSNALTWKFLGSSSTFVKGAAIFQDFGFDKVGTYFVTFISLGIIPCSVSVHVFAGSASRFELTQIPRTNASGGSALHPQPILTFYDLGSNVANISTTTTFVVLLFSNDTEDLPASGNLIGNRTVVSDGPVVTFENIGIRRTALGYKLRFSCYLVPDVLHFPIDVYPGIAHSIHILNHPNEALGAQIFAIQPVILLLDMGGNIAENNHDIVIVSLLFTTNIRSRILGTRNVSAAFGVCSFSDLAVDLIGSHIFGYVAKGIGAAVSPNISISFGPSANLRMVTQPSNISGGSQFLPQVCVEVIDLGGNLVVSNNFSVINITLLSQRGNASLLGNLTSIASSGIACFHNITVDKVGHNYSFLFGFELSSVLSTAFSVTIGDLNALRTLIVPSNGIAGECMLPPPIFELFDAGWNSIHSDTYTAVAQLLHESKHHREFQNSSLNGMFVFGCINATKAGELHIKLLISPGSLIFESANFSIIHGSSHHLVSFRFPDSAVCGVSFSVQPLIRIADTYENFVYFDVPPAISVEASLRHPITGQSLLFGARLQDISHDGSAKFHDLHIDLYTSSHWVIVFTSNVSNIIELISPGLRMNYGHAVKLRAPPEIISAQVGRNIQPYCVTVLDTGGNIKADYVGAISANISMAFTHKMIPVVMVDFLSDRYNLITTSAGLSCFTFAFPVTAIFSLIFRLENEPNISVLTPLFMSSECEVENISFTSPPIENIGGGTLLYPHPKIEINGVGCASSGKSIFSIDSFIFYANGSVPEMSGFKGDVTLHPTNGQVEFKNISIDLSEGPYVIKFVFGTFTVQSNSFFVVVGPSAIMSLVQQPSSINTAGENIIVQPTVGFFDLGMNLNQTVQFHVMATLFDSSISSPLYGHDAVLSIKGLAAFQNLRINLAALNWTLVFSCPGFVSVTSVTFQTKIGHPFELILSDNSQPLNATACLFFPVQPLLTIVDKGNNTVPAGDYDYAQEYLLTNLKIQGIASSLYDWAAVPSKSGIFQLANLTYCNRGFNFELMFSLNNSRVPPLFSRSFSIPVGIAMNLRVIQDSSNVIAGEFMQPPMIVAAQFHDGSFAPDANMMYVNLVSNSSNSSIRVDHLTLTRGISEISSFLWNRTGIFYLEFNLNGLKTVSHTFEIKHSIPCVLSIRSQPTDSIANQNLSPPLELIVLDTFGNAAYSNDIIIVASLLIKGNSSNLQPFPTLTGTRRCSTLLGHCLYYDLSINKAYSDYRILFSSLNFTFAIHSIEFKIKHGAPVKMIMISEPSSTLIAGEMFLHPLQVALVDLGGNIAESGYFQITANSNISSAWMMSNYTSLGISSFFGIAGYLQGSYVIYFSCNGFQTLSSIAFFVLPGPVHRIVFEPVSNGSSVEHLFSKNQYPTVTIRDKGHNVVNVSQEITLFLNASNNASLLGILTVLSLSGIASFENIFLKKNGANYQLLALCNNSGSFLFAESLPFDIRPGPPAVIQLVGSLGFNVDSLISTFFFTTRLIPSICVLITDAAGNALFNITAELLSKGVSNPALSGIVAASTDIHGVACFNDLILKGVHRASITFLFVTKLNNSNVSFAVSNISVLPQLDIEAILDGSFITFSTTLNVPSSFREATSAAFGLNLPTIFDEMTFKSFGVGASCLWISGNQFVVSLGASPSFGMNDPIRFFPFFLQNLFFFEYSALRYVKMPLILPKVAISFSGSTLVFGCAEIGINIFGSTGSYGRPFQTHWRLTSVSDFQFQGNHSKLAVSNAVALQLLNWNNSYAFVISKITIMNETLELPAAKYSFEVETIRWVDGKRSFSEIMVTKTDDLLPTVLIIGPKFVSLFIHQSLELLGIASAACGFRPSFSFNWEITDLSNSLVVLAFTGSTLTVPEYTFSLKSTYDVTLTVTSGRLQSFDKVSIVPKRSAPILRIKGGNGTFVLNSDLILDSSPSIDPDGANFEGMTFEWSCEFQNNSICFTPISSPASRVAIVSKLNLISGISYVFVLKATIRNTDILSTSKVSLFMLPAGVPQVTLSEVAIKIDPEQSLRLEGTVEPEQELIWSEVTKHNILLRSNTFPSTDFRAIVFRPNVLPPGATLKLRLSTVSSTSYAEVEFIINQAPIGGQMLVKTNPFVADIHLAKITMSGWSDDISDLPILFEFSIDNADSVDLASASSTSSARDIFLPTAQRVIIVAKVSDSLGTSRKISRILSLKNTAKTIVKLQNEQISESDSIDQISSKIVDVIAIGDSGALISFINAIFGSIPALPVNLTRVEALRSELISLISGSIPAFPPLRASQAGFIATALANSISNLSTVNSLISVEKALLKLLNSSLINMKPTIIEKIMIITTLTSLSSRQSPKRMLLQDDTTMVPNAENLFVLLNFLEQILSPSLVLGQDVSSYVIPGLTFVAAIVRGEMLCRKVHILEVQTATSISISEEHCLGRNETLPNVVLLSWNMQTNPYSSLSQVALSSGVLRLNARVHSGIQMNISTLLFTVKVYKQPAAWTSMKSLAICVKWEIDIAGSNGHWSAKNCQKMSEDFDHLICSCTGLSSVAITIIQKDCTDEAYGIPGFKANPSICDPEQILPVAIIAGILSAILVLGFIALALYRRFRNRLEFMQQRMQITAANIEETQNSLWTTEAKSERIPRQRNA